MTSPVAAISFKQQHTETNVDADIWVDDESITIFYATGNIVRKIASVDHIEVNLEIFIGRKIILEEHSKRDEPVCRPPKPTSRYLRAVNRSIERIKGVLSVVIIFNVFFRAHNAKTDPTLGIFH